MTGPTSPLALELQAALQWWRLAGVDCDFADDATDWLAVKAQATGQDSASAAGDLAEKATGRQSAAAAPPPEKPVERIDFLGEAPPKDLPEFHQWWLEAPGLDAIGPRGRVPPRGIVEAELMVLVVDPEETDKDALLSGPQGRLLANMLGAMGIAEGQAYFASALPRHTPMADTASLASRGMDAVTAHHIALVAPKRILAFGGNILPLIGHELPKEPTSLREINQTPASVPLFVSEGLDSLMTMPRLKAQFWRRWIEWSVD